MDHIEVVPHMDRWPSFHNGVAAGLRIPEVHDDVDSNWITFNKVKDLFRIIDHEEVGCNCKTRFMFKISPKFR